MALELVLFFKLEYFNATALIKNWLLCVSFAVIAIYLQKIWWSLNRYCLFLRIKFIVERISKLVMLNVQLYVLFLVLQVFEFHLDKMILALT